MQSTFIFLSLFFVVIGASAQPGVVSPPEPQNLCAGADVHFIRRPYFPGVVGSKEFSYHFKLSKAEAGKPTIVVIPGGPGETSIGTSFSVPPGYGILYTDPRGVGCNLDVAGEDLNSLSDDFYTTQNIAEDILAAVRASGLDRYVLYGGSYGTMVATVAAGLAERGTGPRPEAVILSGVIGAAFQKGGIFQGYLDTWEVWLTKLSANARDEFARGSPFGFSNLDWGRAVSAMMIFGKTPSANALSLLEAVSPSAPPRVAGILKGFVQNFSARKALPGAERLYRAIACHEISESISGSAADTDFILENGKLIPVVGHICDGLKLDRPYDSGDWQTSAPIYYFEGTLDPSTPMSQARDHFEKHHSTAQTFVKVLDGGHMALTAALSDCKPAILLSIGSGGSDLNSALGSCSLKTTIQISKP